MFAMIRTIGTENVLPGDPVVLKYDNGFSRIGAYSVGGDAYGFLCENQPAGCGDDWTMYSRIGNRRIIARAAVIMDGGLLVSFDTPLFASEQNYVRVERAGYGMLVKSAR